MGRNIILPLLKNTNYRIKLNLNRKKWPPLLIWAVHLALTCQKIHFLSIYTLSVNQARYDSCQHIINTIQSILINHNSIYKMTYKVEGKFKWDNFNKAVYIIQDIVVSQEEGKRDKDLMISKSSPTWHIWRQKDSKVA